MLAKRRISLILLVIVDNRQIPNVHHDNVHSVGDTDKDLDEDSYYNRDEDAYICSGAYLEESDDLDTPPRFAGDSACHVSSEPVLSMPIPLLYSVSRVPCFSS